MTTRTHIALGVTAHAYSGPDYAIATEDGPSARHDWFVGLANKGADVSRTLYHRFDCRQDAEALAAEVNARGSIDAACWFEGNTWDGVRSEIDEANRLAAWRASHITEAELEHFGLA